MRVMILFLLLLASPIYAAVGDEGQTAQLPGAPSCFVRSACNANELCWITLSNLSDAHVSDCINDPYDYKLCCSNEYPATIRSACNANEFDMFTYSSATGDAHLADIFDPYGQHVCVAPTNGKRMVCEVKPSNEKTGTQECALTLSSEIDAHASWCEDPYNYGLYCEFGKVSAYTPHTFTVSVKPNTIQNTVYVEGVGSQAPNQIATNTYESSYILSYQGRNILGVASFQPQERDVIKTDKDATTHTIALEQPVQRNRMFVILTRADIDQVQERLSQIDSPTDANQVNFGYANDPSMRVNVGIDGNAVIDIQGNETLLPGIHRVEIKKTDSGNGVQTVRIQKE